MFYLKLCCCKIIKALYSWLKQQLQIRGRFRWTCAISICNLYCSTTCRILSIHYLYGWLHLQLLIWIIEITAAVAEQQSIEHRERHNKERLLQLLVWFHNLICLYSDVKNHCSAAAINLAKQQCMCTVSELDVSNYTTVACTCVVHTAGKTRQR